MAKYKVVSITDLFGDKLPIDKMDFYFVDPDNCIASFKGYGNCFAKNYRACDGYTIITEKVGE